MAAIPNVRPDQARLGPGGERGSMGAMRSILPLRAAAECENNALLTFSNSPAELSGSLQDPVGRAGARLLHRRVRGQSHALRVRNHAGSGRCAPAAEGRFIVRNLPAGKY